MIGLEAEIGPTLTAAARLALSLDPRFASALGLSLLTGGCATLLGALIGLPLGAALALSPIPGRRLLTLALGALAALPPMAAGLAAALLLAELEAKPGGWLGARLGDAAQGAWGWAGLLAAAQTLLLTPLIARRVVQRLRALAAEHGESLAALRASRAFAARTLLAEARPALAAAILAAYARALAETGAALAAFSVLPGPRVATLALAEAMARADLALALALAMALSALVLALRGGAGWLQRRAEAPADG